MKTGGKEIDICIKWNRPVDKGKIVLYVDAEQKRFPEFCTTHFTLKRPGLLKTLQVGVGAIGTPINAARMPEVGMEIIAGWDPTKSNTSSNQFLYIRGL